MHLDTLILNGVKNKKEWLAEIEVLVSVMNGKSGTNAQRNTLRRIIKQNEGILNMSNPNQIYTALRKVGELARLPGVGGSSAPNLKLCNFINTRNNPR